MFLHKISINDYRNLAKFKYFFKKPVTVIVGPNGSGKSNLLEAINLLATGMSPRVVRDQEMIKWNENAAWVMGQVGREKAGVNGKNELAVVVKRSQKKFLINRKPKSTAVYRGFFYTVLFGPEAMVLLVDEPRKRRQFLNEMLMLVKKGYAEDLQEYQRILKHRNRLLEKKEVNPEEFLYWDEKFCQVAANLFRERSFACQYLNGVLQAQGLKIEYLPSPRVLRDLFTNNQEEGLVKKIESMLREKLKSLHNKELEMGFTLIGPQRDDWRLHRINGQEGLSAGREIDVGIYGSRGEQRMAIVSLKLAQVDYVQQTIGYRPILLLDDILSELDERNQQRLRDIFGRQQTIITTTDNQNPLLRELCGENAGIIELG